ncbi:MAG: DUF882 domain-containing protein [Alphaproteobacteria bacterium]|nr:DUF882 domain-containing protein [Alphaproteobacteria bacterium]
MKRGLVLLLVCFLCACAAGGFTYHPVSGRGLAKTQPDRDPVRRVVLVYPYTHEKLDVVFFHDGAYDAQAMEKIDELMRDRHANVAGEIDPELIDYLVDIRKRLDLPSWVPFQILSGYRTPESNARLAVTNGNVAKESLHMHGWAVDFRIEGVSGKAICEIAKTMQRGGVAYYPEDNHVHVDLGNIRTWHEAGR